MNKIASMEQGFGLRLGMRFFFVLNGKSRQNGENWPPFIGLAGLPRLHCRILLYRRPANVSARVARSHFRQMTVQQIQSRLLTWLVRPALLHVRPANLSKRLHCTIGSSCIPKWASHLFRIESQRVSKGNFRVPRDVCLECERPGNEF